MNIECIVFSQIIEFFPKYEFNKLVTKYNGNYRLRTFSCWDQFLCMAFAQSSYRESLRDIKACLTAQPNKLYHMGIKGHICEIHALVNMKRSVKISICLYTLTTSFLIHKGCNVIKQVQVD